MAKEGKKKVDTKKGKVEEKKRDEAESEDSGSEEEEVKKTEKVKKNGTKTQKTAKKSEGSDSEDDKPKKAAAKPATPKAAKGKKAAAESDSDSESDSSEEKGKKATPKKAAKETPKKEAKVKTPKKAPKTEEEPKEESKEELNEEPKEEPKKRKTEDTETQPEKKSKTEDGGDANSEATTVFVGNLAWATTEPALKKFFASAGKVTKVSIPLNDWGKPKGFAYVHFSTHAEAQTAVDTLNGQELEGRAVRLDLESKGPTPKDPSEKTPTNVLFVGNLSFDVDEDTLREPFQNYDGLVEVRIAREKETGNSRGFGFAEFDTPLHATKAFQELNESEIAGRQIRLDFQAPKQQGGFGGGRGGGRGGFGGGRGGGRGGFGGGRGRGGGRGGRGGDFQGRKTTFD